MKFLESKLVQYFLLSGLIILKLVLIYCLNNNGFWTINFDELDAYNIAQNIVEGKGQVIYQSLCNCELATARRGPLNILLYQKIIEYGFSLHTLSVVYYTLYFLLFLVSIFCIKKIAEFYVINKQMVFGAVILYCIYPSTLLYIGAGFFYENIAMCTLVIFYYYFVVNNRFNYYLLAVLILSLFSLLIRPHTLLIFCLLSLVVIVINLKKDVWKSITLTFFLFVIILCNYLLMLRNETLTGHRILSSQPGFELLQGHNPYARGSWMNFTYQTDIDHPVYKYVNENAPHIDLKDEFAQSEIRKKIATQWMLNNPKDEMLLSVRKIAIFLLPQNFEFHTTSVFYNPINLIVHMAFLGFVILIILKKYCTYNNLLLVLPFVVSLGISILFFVGYRWRYYCEPFMIIGAVVFAEKLIFSANRTLKYNK